jgi:hypothetical protein
MHTFGFEIPNPYDEEYAGDDYLVGAHDSVLPAPIRQLTILFIYPETLGGPTPESLFLRWRLGLSFPHLNRGSRRSESTLDSRRNRLPAPT